MVSLSKLMEVSEEGVTFLSPHTGELMLLTPEHSIEIQNALGADIIMQLDDVVSSSTTGPRVEEAMLRYHTIHGHRGERGVLPLYLSFDIFIQLAADFRLEKY